MAARLSVEERIRQLHEVRQRSNVDEIRSAAEKALKNSSNVVVQDAAKLIGEFELTDLEQSLLAAWKRFIEHSDPIKADKGCRAKSAIVEALGKLNYDEPDFYMSAITYQQLEPAWGPPEDTAESVRAACAFSLAVSRKLRAVDKLNALVELLQGTRTDRINSLKAMVDTGNEMAIPLVRLKLLSGDAETEVVGACMSSLLSLAGDSSVSLIAKYLTDVNTDYVIEAAAALGAYGRPKAIEAMIAAFGRTRDEELRQTFLLSIGMSRDSSAIEFLIKQLQNESLAETALDALKPACVYSDTRDRVHEILKLIGDRSLLAIFERKFG